MLRVIRKKKLKNRYILVDVFCSECNGEYTHIFRSFKKLKEFIKSGECKCYSIKSE